MPLPLAPSPSASITKLARPFVLYEHIYSSYAVKSGVEANSEVESGSSLVKQPFS